jgi:HAD superfamily hydrolase (TIGR01509 family)
VPKGIIFDIDGTLVDSVKQHAMAWQKAFARYGHDVDLEAIRLQIGKGGDQLMPVFLPAGLIEAKGEEIEQVRSEIYKSEFLPQVRAFPGVRPLFERIAKAGLRIALASSAKGEELETYKRMAGISDLIGAETSSDDAERSKPHPDIFKAALSRLDLPSEQVLVVGDSPFDAEAAGKIGLRTIGLLCGGFPADTLKEAGCIALYEDPAALLRDFDHSPLAGRP